MAEKLVVWFPTVAEVASIAALDASSYGDRCLQPRQWRKLIAAKDAIVFAAGREHLSPLAVLAVKLRGDYGDVLRLAVDPRERRQGLATTLVTVLGEILPLRLELRERSAGALAFAKSVGFVATGVDRGRFGDQDGITLQRTKTVVVT